MRFIKPVKGVGVELPALSAPGSAGDLVSGKEMIDGDGNKVTGNLTRPMNITLTGGGPEMDARGNVVSIGVNDAMNFCSFIGDQVNIAMDPEDFGDAAAADVAAGKTFTSTAGVKIAGSAAAPDTTVEAGDVYLKTINKTTETGTAVQHSHTLTEDVLLKSGSIVRIGMTNASYGDATAADVAEGKTFTGADGFKKVGVMEKGKKISIGTVTAYGGQTLTISNLPFKPTGIFIYHLLYSTNTTIKAGHIENGSGTFSLYTSSTWYMERAWTATTTDSSITITTNISGAAFWNAAVYQYIVWGE